MIKKCSSFSWEGREKKSFIRIREAIAEALARVSPDFKKDFITFAFDISYAAVLTQKNQQEDEVPIYFMSSNLKGVELNYHEVDK